MREAGRIGAERYTRPETSCITHVVTGSESSARDLGSEHQIEHREAGALHDHSKPSADEAWPPGHAPADRQQRQPDHDVTGVEADVQPEKAIETGRSGEISNLEALPRRERERQIHSAPGNRLDRKVIEQRHALATQTQEPEQCAAHEHARCTPDGKSEQMSTL